MPRVPFDPATDYYQLLGVTPGASAEEIQAAYRRLAKAYHPDLNAGSALAEARMARLNIAKSVLLDSATRASYDQVRASRRAATFRAAAAARAAGAGYPAQAHGHATSVRYAPTAQTVTRPRYRVVPASPGRRTSRVQMDRQTGVLLLLALPLAAALVMYVVQAVQLSAVPLRQPPADLALSPTGPTTRLTARGTADAVFLMVHLSGPNRDLANRANNLIVSRRDDSPESELLRADGRRLVRAAASDDVGLWNATVSDLCRLAGRC